MTVDKDTQDKLADMFESAEESFLLRIDETRNAPEILDDYLNCPELTPVCDTTVAFLYDFFA